MKNYKEKISKGSLKIWNIYNFYKENFNFPNFEKLEISSSGKNFSVLRAFPLIDILKKQFSIVYLPMEMFNFNVQDIVFYCESAYRNVQFQCTRYLVML